MRHALAGVWVAALLVATAGEATDSADSPSAEKTLAAIEACMARSPVPWPDQWRREYLDTVRQAISEIRDQKSEISRYGGRLEVLIKGFEPYWQGLKKSGDRPSFELQLAQIRWYTEHLMATGPPSREGRQKVREQYKALWDHAATALVAQFPFLDPNIVQKAKEDHVADCCRKIDVPLLPIFLHPLTDGQLDQLKQRWQDLRYSRVDLWRQINSDNLVETQNLASLQTPSLTAHPHYLLTQRSLSQLLSQAWGVAVSPPDYYRTAATNLTNAERRRLQARSQAYSQERRLERERSRQFLQTEQIGFLLSALVETAKAPPSAPPGKQPSTIQGGDAYDVNDVSSNQ